MYLRLKNSSAWFVLQWLLLGNVFSDFISSGGKPTCCSKSGGKSESWVSHRYIQRDSTVHMTVVEDCVCVFCWAWTSWTFWWCSTLSVVWILIFFALLAGSKCVSRSCGRWCWQCFCVYHRSERAIVESGELFLCQLNPADCLPNLEQSELGFSIVCWTDWTYAGSLKIDILFDVIYLSCSPAGYWKTRHLFLWVC